jgi:TolB protein
MINVDGSGRREIPMPGSNVARPMFSPDGKRLAVAIGSGDSIAIHTVAIDGSGARALTSSEGSHAMPAWSPDGTKLLYSYRSSRAGHWHLFVINRNGEDRKQLSTDAGDDGSFSPDGSRIVFASDRVRSRYEVWIMNADGSGQRSLTEQVDGSSSAPKFSPDGRRIVFSVFKDGRSSLWVMEADGSGARPLAGFTENGRRFGDRSSATAMPGCEPINDQRACRSARTPASTDSSVVAPKPSINPGPGGGTLR